MNNVDKPIVGITIGDVAGIGPEIVVKSLLEKELYAKCRPLIIGDPKVVQLIVKTIGARLSVRSIDSVRQAKSMWGSLDVLAVAPIDLENFRFGEISPQYGEAAVLQSKEAARLAIAGELDAIASAPVNKEAMRQAGYSYEGQTQLFAEYTGVKKYGMLLLFDKIRCMMLSTHMSLIDACKLVNKDRILRALELMDGSMRLFVKGRRPIIAVSALNPHGGEGGLFGHEEIEEIIPAVKEANSRLSCAIVGPVPSDTIFVRALDGEFDAVLSLFHDQANMGMKLIRFGEIVTYILGLPLIRTSVGHGTAFDIAGKNIARHKNFKEAIGMAAILASAKKTDAEPISQMPRHR